MAPPTTKKPAPAKPAPAKPATTPAPTKPGAKKKAPKVKPVAQVKSGPADQKGLSASVLRAWSDDVVAAGQVLSSVQPSVSTLHAPFTSNPLTAKPAKSADDRLKALLVELPILTKLLQERADAMDKANGTTSAPVTVAPKPRVPPSTVVTTTPPPSSAPKPTPSTKPTTKPTTTKPTIKPTNTKPTTTKPTIKPTNTKPTTTKPTTTKPPAKPTTTTKPPAKPISKAKDWLDRITKPGLSDAELKKLRNELLSGDVDLQELSSLLSEDQVKAITKRLVNLGDSEISEHDVQAIDILLGIALKRFSSDEKAYQFLAEAFGGRALDYFEVLGHFADGFQEPTTGRFNRFAQLVARASRSSGYSVTNESDVLNQIGHSYSVNLARLIAEAGTSLSPSYLATLASAFLRNPPLIDVSYKGVSVVKIVQDAVLAQPAAARQLLFGPFPSWIEIAQGNQAEFLTDGSHLFPNDANDRNVAIFTLGVKQALEAGDTASVFRLLQSICENGMAHSATGDGKLAIAGMVGFLLADQNAAPFINNWLAQDNGGAPQGMSGPTKGQFLGLLKNLGQNEDSMNILMGALGGWTKVLNATEIAQPGKAYLFGANLGAMIFAIRDPKTPAEVSIAEKLLIASLAGAVGFIPGGVMLKTFAKEGGKLAGFAIGAMKDGAKEISKIISKSTLDKVLRGHSSPKKDNDDKVAYTLSIAYIERVASKLVGIDKHLRSLSESVGIDGKTRVYPADTYETRIKPYINADGSVNLPDNQEARMFLIDLITQVNSAKSYTDPVFNVEEFQKGIRSRLSTSDPANKINEVPHNRMKK